MRSLIKLALIIIVALVGYNYFFGTSDEKKESQEIVDQFKDLGKSIGGFLKNEKEKFQDGKYDNLFSDIGNMFDNIKEKIKSTDKESRETLDNLEKEKSKLEEKWKELDPSDSTSGANEEFLEDMRRLFEKTERLVKDVEDQ